LSSTKVPKPVPKSSSAASQPISRSASVNARASSTLDTAAVSVNSRVMDSGGAPQSAMTAAM